MSIWTSSTRRAAPLAVVVFLLAACVIEGEGRSSAPPATPGGVALAAPSGFCLVDSTRQSRGDADLAAFRRCPGSTAQDAILTVAVGSAGSAQGLSFDGPEMVSFVTSDAGRRALSRSNDARSVTVHEVRRSDGAVLLRLTDRAQPGVVNGWRAVTGLRGRLVTLALRNPEEGPTVEPTEAEKLINRFLSAMRAANR